MLHIKISQITFLSNVGLHFCLNTNDIEGFCYTCVLLYVNIDQLVLIIYSAASDWFLTNTACSIMPCLALTELINLILKTGKHRDWIRTSESIWPQIKDAAVENDTIMMGKAIVRLDWVTN